MMSHSRQRVIIQNRINKLNSAFEGVSDNIDLGDGDNKKLTREERADAWRLHFNSVDVDDEDKDPHNEAGRCYYGRTIRPVREKQKDEEQ